MSNTTVIKPVYGPTNPTPEDYQNTKVKRIGMVIGLVAEKEQYYRDLHSGTWPSVLQRIKDSNIRNFSIYTAELDGKKYLFGYWEYIGDDYEADMQATADDPETKRWYEECVPCQIPLPNRKPGEHWMQMEMLFLTE
jgi:L-rhamnose mutarotase